MAVMVQATLIECPACKRKVSASASQCIGCGHPFAKNVVPGRKDKVLGAMLSLVLPGAGSMYAGAIWSGLAVFLVVSLTVWWSVQSQPVAVAVWTIGAMYAIAIYEAVWEVNKHNKRLEAAGGA